MPMRPSARPLTRTHLFLAMLVAACGVVAAPAAAQSSARSDDAASRMVALAARTGAARFVGVERNAHDAIRSTARDTASPIDAVPMPYRSTPSAEVSPGGFAMRLPGTHLDLTNGSLSMHHAGDGRYARGVHFSAQLTY